MTSPLAAALKKAVGTNDEIQQVKMWLDTGFPPLNKAISGKYDGGIPSGRITEMFGPSSAGKTLLATQVMISAQKAGGVSVFCDHENSFDVGLAAQYGLETDEDLGTWLYKQPETFEDAMELAGTVMKTIRENALIPVDAPIVFVFDSLASMVPRSKAEKMGEKDLNMNDNTALARATAAWLPTLAMWCRKFNATCLFLNQIRVKIGVMFGDNSTAPGGNSPEFYSSVRIKLSRSQIKDGSEKTGQTITAECIKNKVSKPYQKASWDYYFDTTKGFDVYGSSVDHLVDVGVFAKSGGFLEYKGKKVRRAQLAAILEENGMDSLMSLFNSVK